MYGHVIHEKGRRFLHNRISDIRQESLIATVRIVLHYRDITSRMGVDITGGKNQYAWHEAILIKP
ncbi:hypothetical protein [Paenibacillus uliginis]|uniref:hypothetical protein n=1 Tax=Paenibacillus uliginis TaxID=683737 RepID=UPI00313F2F78